MVQCGEGAVMKPIIELAAAPLSIPIKPRKKPGLPAWMRVPWSRPGATNLVLGILEFTP